MIPAQRRSARTRLRLLACLTASAVALSAAAVPAGAVAQTEIEPGTQLLTVDGTVRTIMRDERGNGAYLIESRVLAVDVAGTLLHVPAADGVLLSDRQPVTVSITAPEGMSTPDALASAGGATPGGEATVSAVVAAGEAPVIDTLPNADGLHTVTVLPVYWATGDPWVDTVGWRVDALAQKLANVWPAASQGRLTTSVTSRAATQVPGSPTCDPVTLYNLAMRGHGEPLPDGAFEHIAVLAPRDGLSCGEDSHAVIGGPQLWPSDLTPAHDFGHNLGLGHAGAPAECPPVEPLTIRTDTQGCPHRTAGDRSDVMGERRDATVLRATFAELLGWARTVTASPERPLGIGLSAPGSSGDTHAARVPLSSGGELWVEDYGVSDMVTYLRFWSGGVPYIERTGAPLSNGDLRAIEGTDYVLTNDWMVARVTHRSLDSSPPTAPVITAPADGTLYDYYTGSFEMAWTPAADAGTGVVTYRLYIDGEWAGDAPRTQFSSRYTAIPSGAQSATYVIEALDAAGNGTTSTPIVIKREGQAPAPTGVRVVTGYESAHITWEIAETHPDLTQQRIQLTETLPGFPFGARLLEPDVRSLDLPALGPKHYGGTIGAFNGIQVWSSTWFEFDVAPPTITMDATTTDGRAPILVSWTLSESPAAPPESFRVDVDGVVAATTAGTETSIEIPARPGAHRVTVTAIDPWGASITSTPVDVVVAPGPDEWVAITAPADGSTATSPVRLGWEVGPGLVDSLGYCAVSLDGVLVRYVLPDGSGVALATGAGSHTVTLTCFTPDGLEAASDSAAVQMTSTSGPFTDVPASHPFSSQVTWMFNRGITTGYPDGTYRPRGTINRDAMAAFLFRYAGADIEGYEAPDEPIFSDVPIGHPFYREISWMYETGISTGNPDGTYRPKAPVSRGAMAAFLYRFAGGPTPADPLPASFSDVTAANPFRTQITWLASAGITTGYPDGTFRPTQAIARDAMAAFLARMDAQWPRAPFEGTSPTPT